MNKKRLTFLVISLAFVILSFSNLFGNWDMNEMMVSSLASEHSLNDHDWTNKGDTWANTDSPGMYDYSHITKTDIASSVVSHACISIESNCAVVCNSPIPRSSLSDSSRTMYIDGFYNILGSDSLETEIPPT